MLFGVRQLPRMNHEDCPVIIHNEDNLKQPICASRAPDEIFVIGPTQRVRSSSLRDHLFGLIRIDPVFCQMFDIPVIPAKLHLDFTSELTKWHFNIYENPAQPAHDYRRADGGRTGVRSVKM
jgi:hypothetical protein